jgi:hypothetical protein
MSGRLRYIEKARISPKSARRIRPAFGRVSDKSSRSCELRKIYTTMSPVSISVVRALLDLVTYLGRTHIENNDSGDEIRRPDV